MRACVCGVRVHVCACVVCVCVCCQNILPWTFTQFLEGRDGGCFIYKYLTIPTLKGLGHSTHSRSPQETWSPRTCHQLATHLPQGFVWVPLPTAGGHPAHQGSIAGPEEMADGKIFLLTSSS